MWCKNYNEVSGIVTKAEDKHLHDFEMDFEKLSKLANNSKFIEKVKKTYEEDKDSFKNIVVYQMDEIHKFGPRKGENVNTLFVVFDHHNTYISLFGVETNSNKENPYIFEFSQNKTFVSIMSELL